MLPYSSELLDSWMKNCCSATTFMHEGGLFGLFLHDWSPRSDFFGQYVSCTLSQRGCHTRPRGQDPNNISDTGAGCLVYEYTPLYLSCWGALILWKPTSMLSLTLYWYSPALLARSPSWERTGIGMITNIQILYSSFLMIFISHSNNNIGKTRSSKDECSTGSNNHLKSTYLFMYLNKVHSGEICYPTI